VSLCVFRDQQYKEDALYYKFDSAYQLGINKRSCKMEERLNVAKTAYLNLVNLMQKQNIKESRRNVSSC
jgi:outer membrane protein assembly factor BamD